MILPPPQLILGVLFFVFMGFFMLWFSKRRMRSAYETLNSLTRNLQGSLDKKKAFWSGIPTFVGSYSNFQFTLFYGAQSGGAPQNRLWLYCRRLPIDQKGRTMPEEVIQRQYQQIVSDGWTYVSHENNELRVFRDLSLPLNPDLIKTTLDNLNAAERGEFKTPSSNLVGLETAKSESKAKKRKAAVVHAVMNLFIIGLVYYQIGHIKGGMFAHIVAALLIIESAGFILYLFKFKK